MGGFCFGFFCSPVPVSFSSLVPVVSAVDDLLEYGSIHASSGGQYSFRVIGPCCRLFDREDLPWPCSRLAWKSKEPSWRRVGSRFVPDLAARRCPSYSVELLQPNQVVAMEYQVSQANSYNTK